MLEIVTKGYTAFFLAFEFHAETIVTKNEKTRLAYTTAARRNNYL